MFSREINLEKLLPDEKVTQNGKSMRASHADFVQGVRGSKVTWQRVETSEMGTALRLDCKGSSKKYGVPSPGEHRQAR